MTNIQFFVFKGLFVLRLARLPVRVLTKASLQTSQCMHQTHGPPHTLLGTIDKGRATLDAWRAKWCRHLEKDGRPNK